jgi:hypothetical protein
MTAVLEYMALMNDREIRDDLDCVLDALPEAEHEAAKTYRSLRMRAPGWLPDKPGSNNHRNVKGQRHADADDRACACGCGQALPRLADRARKFHSDACRKRSLRSPQVDSPGRNAVQDGSPSGASRVRELSPDSVVLRADFRTALTA